MEQLYTLIFISFHIYYKLFFIGHKRCCETAFKCVYVYIINTHIYSVYICIKHTFSTILYYSSQFIKVLNLLGLWRLPVEMANKSHGTLFYYVEVIINSFVINVKFKFI